MFAIIQGLKGKRVALTGTRKIDELRTIVEKLGGNAVHRPTQGTVTVHPDQVDAAVGQFITTGADWVVLTTGMGVEILLASAIRQGRQDAFVVALQNARVAARGYKTVRVLKSLGLTPQVRDEDGTTAGLMRALEQVDFRGENIAVQLHGVPAPKLVQSLHARGAIVTEILPYEHTPPDAEAVDLLVQEILTEQVDAVTFTSALQVRGLLDRVQSCGQMAAVRSVFQQNVVVAAVGKVTAEALHEAGMQRVVVPEEERMGSMMVSLAKFYLSERAFLRPICPDI